MIGRFFSFLVFLQLNSVMQEWLVQMCMLLWMQVMVLIELLSSNWQCFFVLCRVSLVVWCVWCLVRLVSLWLVISIRCLFLFCGRVFWVLSIKVLVMVLELLLVISWMNGMLCDWWCKVVSVLLGLRYLLVGVVISRFQFCWRVLVRFLGEVS